MAIGELTEGLRETLAVFETSGEPGEPLTTAEVADRLDVSRRSTYTRLEKLVDEGFLRTKKAGARGRVWWRPPERIDGDREPPATLLDDLSAVVYRCRNEPGWPMEFVGGDCRSLTGYDSEALVSGAISWGGDVVHPQDVDHVWETVQSGLDRGGRFSLQYRIRTADGETRWVWERGRAAGGGSGEPTVLEGLITDATELKRQTRHLEHEIEAVFERVDEAFYALDDEFRFTYVNERAEELLSYSEDELLGERLWEMFPETAEVPEVRERFQTAMEAQEPTSIEVYSDLLGFWVEANIYPSETGLSVYFRDISERKERELELERTKERFRKVFEYSNDAIYIIDPYEDEIVAANPAGCEMLGYTREALLTLGPSDVHPDELERFRAFVDEVYETESGFTDELTCLTKDGHRISTEISASTVELEDGTYMLAIVRDISERKERERALEESRRRYRALVENFPNGAVALVDEDLRYRIAGGSPLDEAADTGDDLEGMTVREAITPELADVLEPRYRAALQGESSTFEHEHAGNHSRFHIFPVRDDDGNVFAAMGMSQDVTDRKERERELERTKERYRALAENFPNGGVGVYDEDLRYTLVTGTMWDDIEPDAEDIEGNTIWEALPPETAADVEPIFRDALAGETGTVVSTLGGRTYRVWATPLHNADGEITGGQSFALDITDQLEREQQLAESERRYRTLAEYFPNGIVTLFDHDLRYRLAAGQAFDEIPVDPEEVEGKHFREIWEGEEALDAVEAALEATLDGEERSVEVAYEGREWLLRTVPITDERGDVFAGMTMAQDITERKESERELVRQREHLAALNELNEVVRDITETVLEQSTREEIEEIACERLAATDSYRFAWIGEVDRSARTVDVRAEAGAAAYLEEVTVSVDPADEHSEGPPGRALRTGEIQTIDDVDADPGYEPWREAARNHDVRSSAAIPIVHGETVYGVLNVYADRANAFEGQERAVVGQLGEVIGHAIASVERKQALLSDEVVELQFRIPRVFESLDVDAAAEGRITLEAVVPVSDGEFLVYGTATADAVDDVSAIVEAVPYWEEVTFYDAEGDTTFELRLTEPPVLSTLAALGGSVEEVVIEDGDYRMTLQLSPSADARQLIEAVQDAYPAAEMLARRQVTQPRERSERVDTVLTEALTDRQRTALRAAYYAGFFEWPRNASGEDLAASLGVSPPTYHQHLRKAERKVFDALLSDSTASG